MKPVNPLRLAPAKREMQPNHNFKVQDETQIAMKAQQNLQKMEKTNTSSFNQAQRNLVTMIETVT
jgi:hypothetical protein